MLFNTPEFAVFLAVVFCVYHCLRTRAQNVLLLVASYVFYGWWDWRFCSLLALSTIVDFVVARSIEGSSDARRRRRLLLVSLSANLGMLGIFKYLDFFTGSAVHLLEALGFHPDLPTLGIVLPVGISFYTFQTMAYTIDVYRRRMRATRDPIAFGVYVAYFPQLVAGPIERAQRLLPQITRRRRVDAAALSSGVLLFTIGLVRKVVIADGVAPIVDEVFADPGAHTASRVALGVFFFGLQIYGDFAGYSDMARGVSRLLGIELVENFQHPYVATNITDFWRRWHVSLSQWLRDYLYIPLGGNRGSPLATYRNLFLTMFLGGLWHGASWTFVVWGSAHGLALALHKLVVGRGRARSADLAQGAAGRAVRLCNWAFTMAFVWLAWVFFRAPDFDGARTVLAACVNGAPGGSALELSHAAFYVAVLALIDVPQILGRDHCAVLRWPAVARGALYTLWLILIVGAWSSDASPFIYFQF